MTFSMLSKRLIDISSMCIVIFIGVRNQKPATYPRGLRSWLRHYFANGKENHSNGRCEPPSYEQTSKNVGGWGIKEGEMLKSREAD